MASDQRRQTWRKIKNAQAKAKADFLREYKGSNPCVDCGASHPHWRMELDHVPDRGSKVAPVSTMTGGSWKALYAELAKCDLVCALCHKDRTYRRLAPMD